MKYHLYEEIRLLKDLRNYIIEGRKPFDINEALPDILRAIITIAETLEAKITVIDYLMDEVTNT